MNNCRLKYKNETGNYPEKGNTSSLFGSGGDDEYWEWLETKYEQLLKFVSTGIEIKLNETN